MSNALIRDVIGDSVRIIGKVISCRNLGNLVFLKVETDDRKVQVIIENIKFEKSNLKNIVGQRVFVTGTMQKIQQTLDQEVVATSVSIIESLARAGGVAKIVKYAKMVSKIYQHLLDSGYVFIDDKLSAAKISDLEKSFFQQNDKLHICLDLINDDLSIQRQLAMLLGSWHQAEQLPLFQAAEALQIYACVAPDLRFAPRMLNLKIGEFKYTIMLSIPKPKDINYESLDQSFMEARKIFDNSIFFLKNTHELLPAELQSLGEDNFIVIVIYGNEPDELKNKIYQAARLLGGTLRLPCGDAYCIVKHQPNYYTLIRNGRVAAECKVQSYKLIAFMHHANLNPELANIEIQLDPSMLHDQDDMDLNSQISSQPSFVQEWVDTIKAEIMKIEIAEHQEIKQLILQIIVDDSVRTNELLLQHVLEIFAMSYSDATKILDLLPNKKQTINGLPVEQQFQFFWSILGHKHAQSILQTTGFDLLKKLVDLKIVTEYKQILYLDAGVLKMLDNVKTTTKTLKIMFNNCPNSFGNLIYTFAGQSKAEAFSMENILDAAAKGFSTPLLFALFSHNNHSKDAVSAFTFKLKSFRYLLLPNIEISPREIAAKFVQTFNLDPGLPENHSYEIYAELIQYIFRPVNMNYKVVSENLLQLTDRCFDFANNSIHFGGANWDEIEKCYFFRIPLLQIYASKNRASFFAKASAGICTAIDIDLFNRPDHYHLNLVDFKNHLVVGNVQLYLFSNNGQRSLLLRGINPSASFVTESNANLIIRAVFEASIQIAQNSNITQVLLCPSLGIWHAESSRMEVIAALKLMTNVMQSISFEKELFLFAFGKQRKSIKHGYLIWSQEDSNITYNWRQASYEQFNDMQKLPRR